ncbi:tRNA lysidine(34) synthetase TilS [Maribrevibacterium harenarium]|uniref:tRNA(Ile)-lysidine synthase n=1 Tax=Maribrevibacterium harenarium TaxID=2589817 RepID=A0A501WX32_9GAMM|nr:tRNA lysidine(34) synthetase TilS [Maribrevibacterium harenarium]TPE52815.1 tRNA lysidine(34) synthetase TilS [Maribrevibacterium harenarium]
MSSVMLALDWQALSQTEGRVVIAYSGGLDSHVLLHLAATHLTGVAREHLRALHVNHQLSPNADSWQQHCEQVCADLGVAFRSERVTVSDQGSLELAARQARYQAFDLHLNAGDVLLQAHHANDQLETLLMRLERGTGLRGLGGIPATRQQGKWRIVRPLLIFSRSQLLEYAQCHNLDWVEDESNQETVYRRNLLRHEVVEKWQQFNPQIAGKVAQQAEQWQQDLSIHQRLVRRELEKFLAPDGSLSWSSLPESEPAFWMQQYLQGQDINVTQGQLQALVTMLASEADGMPECQIGQSVIRRFKGRIFVMSTLAEQPSLVTLTPHQWQEQVAFSICCDQSVQLGKRPEGIKLLLANGKHRPLKKWLQERQIPHWWREQLPYLFVNNELVAIGTLWQHPNWQGKVQWRDHGVLPWPYECQIID